MPMLGGTPMRRLFTLAALLLVAACENDPSSPNVVEGSYSLERIEGRASNGASVTVIAGDLTLSSGRYEMEVTTSVAPGDRGTFGSEGRYTTTGQGANIRVEFISDFDPEPFEGTLASGLLTYTEGSWKYHWRRN